MGRELYGDKNAGLNSDSFDCPTFKYRQGASFRRRTYYLIFVLMWKKCRAAWESIPQKVNKHIG